MAKKPNSAHCVTLMLLASVRLPARQRPPWTERMAARRSGAVGIGDVREKGRAFHAPVDHVGACDHRSRRLRCDGGVVSTRRGERRGGGTSGAEERATRRSLDFGHCSYLRCSGFISCLALTNKPSIARECVQSTQVLIVGPSAGEFASSPVGSRLNVGGSRGLPIRDIAMSGVHAVDAPVASGQANHDPIPSRTGEHWTVLAPICGRPSGRSSGSSTGASTSSSFVPGAGG